MTTKKTAFFRVFAVFFAVFLCFFSLSVTAFAGEKTFGKSDENALETLEKRIEDLLPDEAKDGLFEENDAETASKIGLLHMLSLLSEAVAESREKALSFCSILLGFCILSALAGECTLSSELRPYLRLGVALFLLTPALFSILSDVEEAIGSLGSVNRFFGSCLPAFCAVELAGGGTLSASFANVAMGAAFSLIARLCDGAAAPLVRLLFAFSLFSAVDPSGRGAKLSARTGRAFVTLSGAVSAFSVGLFSLQTAVASAKDRGTLRAAKYAAGLLPGVGQTLSASLSSLAGGVSYLKGAVGGSVVAAAFAMLIPPLALLVLDRVALFLAGSLLDLLGDEDGARLLLPFRTALDAAVWLYVLSSSVWIFEIVIFMKSGVPIAS